MTRAVVSALVYGRLTQVQRDRAHGLPCLYCWEPMRAPSWDHVIPRSKGGPNCRGNLVVVCRECNSLKDDMSLPEFEGYLHAIRDHRANKVAAFSAWITREWDADERAQYSRLVRRAWRDAIDGGNARRLAMLLRATIAVPQGSAGEGAGGGA